MEWVVGGWRYVLGLALEDVHVLPGTEEAEQQREEEERTRDPVAVQAIMCRDLYACSQPELRTNVNRITHPLTQRRVENASRPVLLCPN